MAAGSLRYPNILFLMSDQQRFDAIRYVQDRLERYRGQAKINTPHLDQLLTGGAYFRNAYSPCAVCAPTRTTLRTGCTIERTGAQSNSMVSYGTYNRMAQFRQKINHLESGLRYDEPRAIQEWTVAYYALCEEIDFHIGRLLNELKALGLADNTLVLFCSDHGEMLGAHGMREKNIFLEESAHVPLLIRYPGHIPAQTQVETPVSLLDVFATLLDYSSAADYDQGDGRSLRRYIEHTSFNENDDDEAIVTEWDYRTPVNGKLDRSLGGAPSFLCRKGPWKLMISKKADSSLYDMLYNLEHDPYEMSNLIYTCDEESWITEEAMIGKAEHLKALLLDWMKRMDGPKKYYSDPFYNLGEGRGDIEEVRQRRNWGASDFWVSDTHVSMGEPAYVQGRYRKNVWIYFGTTTPGDLTIQKVVLQGKPANTTLKGFTQGTIAQGYYQKCAVCFNAPIDRFEPVDVVITASKQRQRFEKRIQVQ